jgi:hypothetical protein
MKMTTIKEISEIVQTCPYVEGNQHFHHFLWLRDTLKIKEVFQVEEAKYFPFFLISVHQWPFVFTTQQCSIGSGQLPNQYFTTSWGLRLPLSRSSHQPEPWRSQIHQCSTLAVLEDTAYKAFKVYMTCKTQGWFQRWGCLRPSDAAASPGRGAAPDGAGSGAGAETPACPPALAASSDAGASDLITGGGCDDQPTSPSWRQPWTWRRCHLRAGWSAHAIQGFKTSAHSSPRRVYSHWKFPWFHIWNSVWFAIWHCRSLWLGYDIIVNIMVNIMVTIMADIIDLWYQSLLIS